MPKPLISIIVTAYNKDAFIEKAINSAFIQLSSAYELEVVVVDDHSTDNTHEVIERLKVLYNFRLLTTKKNVGASAARNLGIKNARGQWLNFLDGDDYLLPGKIKTQIDALKSHPKVRICYTDCFIMRGNKLEKEPLSKSWPTASGNIYSHLLLRNCIALHSALVDAGLAKKTLFDEKITTAEDYDFWLRIAKDGHEFLYIDEPLAVYRRGPNSLSQPTLKTFDFALKVLDINGSLPLNSSERQNLHQHKSVLLQNKADILLRRFKRRGYIILKEASEFGEIPRYKKLSLRIMSHQFFVGTILYWLLDLRSRLRARVGIKK